MANEFVIKNGYFSQGNSNVTGSLQVTGSVGVTGSVSITQYITASKVLFSSSNGNQLTVIGSGSTLAQVYGSQGNLLTVNDTFSGSIFTVTDISGYPILDVTSDYYTGSVFMPMMQSQSQQHVVVYNSASGLLTYVSASAVGGGGSGTPGGLNKQIQFNGLGGFSGSSNFTFDSASNVLLLTGSAQVTGSLIVSGGFVVYNTSPKYKIIDTTVSTLSYSSGFTSVGWGDSQLRDTNGITSINWSDRYLYGLDGETILVDWSENDKIIVNGDIIPEGPYTNNTSLYNLGSPTAAWNEIYVSNGSVYFISGSVSASIGFNNGAISFNNATISIPTGSVIPSTSNIIAKYMGTGLDLTGSAAISASYNLLIPANTFTVGDTIRIQCYWDKPNAASNTSFYFYITGSTTEFSRSVTGATQVARFNTTTVRGLGMTRLLFVSSSTSTTLFSPTTGNLPSDEFGTISAGTGGISSLNIDWTTDKWFIFAAANATTADLTRAYRFIATKV
jgi:hypothetical protein